MNPGATNTLDLMRAEHRIASHRSLQSLVTWGEEIATTEVANGRRVMWAPCHALSGVTLRAWLMDRAGEAIGTDAESDVPTLLSGAADVIIIVDPAAADPASLTWLSDLLACAEAAREVAVTPPLPELVILAPTGSSNDHAQSFIDRLRALGGREIRISGREADLSTADVRNRISALRSKDEALLAVAALLPCPVEVDDLDEICALAGATGAVKALTASNLFRVIDGYLVATSRDVQREIRAALGTERLQDVAARIAGAFEHRFESLPDARIEVLMLAGDSRKAVRLARNRFEENYAAGRYQEALRIVELSTQLNLPMEGGRFAREIDEAKLAAMQAEVGNYDKARETITELTRRRELYRTPALIQWLALGSRTLAMRVGYDPRTTDSLMRRAIRLAGDDLDKSVQLTVLRVQLLESGVFSLDDRASWLLTHVNNKMLNEVSQQTQAAFLEETAGRHAARNDFKGAFKRLRRLVPIDISDKRRAGAMLLMAKCRAHFADLEGALRYATNALHFAIRAADLDVVERAIKFIKDTERGRPKAMPRITPNRPQGIRPKLTALADLPSARATDASKLFDMLATRFGALHWVRRRGERVATFGKPQPGPDVMSVFVEDAEGNMAAAARSAPVASGSRGVALMRPDGHDLVIFSTSPDAEPREESIVRFLLADRAEAGSNGAAAPSRRSIVDDYLRRAHAQGGSRGLHATMEILFNKDILIYMDEQGLTKEEMAERLGVSRATLYRMYARAGLN